jgi:hypothetical protein
MEEQIGFKVTVEYYCLGMIDEKTFIEKFNADPFESYKYISDNFKDGPDNFSDDNKIVKVEIL